MTRWSRDRTKGDTEHLLWLTQKKFWPGKISWKKVSAGMSFYCGVYYGRSACRAKWLRLTQEQKQDSSPSYLQRPGWMIRAERSANFARNQKARKQGQEKGLGDE